MHAVYNFRRGDIALYADDVQLRREAWNKAHIVDMWLRGFY